MKTIEFLAYKIDEEFLMRWRRRKEGNRI